MLIRTSEQSRRLVSAQDLPSLEYVSKNEREEMADVRCWVPNVS